MTLLVDHDVSVVSVLNLEQESNDGVSSHRLNEVLPCRLELFRRLVPVLVLEVRVQAFVRLPADLVT